MKNPPEVPGQQGLSIGLQDHIVRHVLRGAVPDGDAVGIESGIQCTGAVVLRQQEIEGKVGLRGVAGYITTAVRRQRQTEAVFTYSAE